MEKDMNGLDGILADLYGAAAEDSFGGEENSESQKTVESSENREVIETEMSDEELALSVNVDLPETADKADEQPKQIPEAKAPEKKQKTAEEIQAIRKQAEEDVKSLREAFPELSKIKGLSELSDPQKYLDYRKKGLTAEEAYTLTYAGQRKASGTRKPDLRSSPNGGGPTPSGLTSRELSEARAQTGLDDETLRKYYRKF